MIASIRVEAPELGVFSVFFTFCSIVLVQTAKIPQKIARYQPIMAVFRDFPFFCLFP